MYNCWSICYIILCLIPFLLEVNSFSCHQCTSVTVQSLSKKEAKHYSTKVDRCVDFDGEAKCVSNLQQGLCHLTVLPMRSQCNKTCDLCRFRDSGEMQPYDVEYWDSETDFSENFLVVNVSLVSAESSSYESGLGPNNTIDGNLTSYFATKFDSEPFVVVNLGGSFNVYYVYVINRWGDDIDRRNIITINTAKVSAFLIPSIDSEAIGSSTFCGEIKMREGFSLDLQSYRVECATRPMSTHVKVFRVDYNMLELTEIKVGISDDTEQCGNALISQCNPFLGSDKCLKTEFSGIWHGKRILYTARSCHYASLTDTTNCTKMIRQLNRKWEHLRSDYEIEGAYDPNSFAMSTCEQYLCDGNHCNGVTLLSSFGAYLIIIQIIVLNLEPRGLI